jgi:hypothetical protein
MWERISALMRTRPYTFNIVSSGAIAFVGDYLAQRIEHQQGRQPRHARADAIPTTSQSSLPVASAFQMDALRSGTICGWSAIAMAPFYTQYFKTMDRYFPLKTVPHIGAKVLITASAVAPVMNGLYLAITTAIEDRLGDHPRPTPELWQAIDDKVRAELLGLVINSAQLWMPVNTLNWMFFPAHARVLLSTVVSVGWNAYISLVQHRPLPNEL